MPTRDPNRAICPPDHEHAGSGTCYNTHSCGCDPCLKRATAYARWRSHTPAERKAYTHVPAIGTRRRLQALMWLGYSPAAMGRHLGLDHSIVWRWARNENVTRITAARVRRMFDELSTQPLDPQTKAEKISVNKMRAQARRNGWHSPDAWWDVDIDDPDAAPDTASVPDEPGWIVDELAHRHGLGESPRQAAAALGRTRTSLAKTARRHNRPDLARWLGEVFKPAEAA